MPKITTKSMRDQSRHVPLYKDIAAEKGNLRASGRKASKVSKKKGKVQNNEGENQDEVTFDAASSRKILKLAKEQQEEIEQEEEDQANRKAASQFKLADSDLESDEEEKEKDDEEVDEDYGEEEIEIQDADEQDMKLFESYFKPDAQTSTSAVAGSFNLADKILEKIREKEMEEQTKSQEEEQSQNVGDKEEPEQGEVFLPPRVIEAYEKVGESLSAWTHGKLPKLFKVLPSIKNWEDILYVTNPEKWTPNVVYEATRLFVSNLPSNKAQRFVSMVLYPRFRDNIEESEDHKLNYHLYMSLKKCIYKPAAFFKGFLFPLVEEQCTAREAMIVASILKKCSIPVQHASVALSWLLQRDFSPQATVFIRVLIEKKYALPYQTIDDLVFYFMKFRVITDQSSKDVMLDADDTFENSEQRKMKEAPQLPVVWHKALLAFAQRYKNDITEDQRDFLMEVIRQRGHKDMGPETRRELLAGKKRQDMESQKKVSEDDDIMSYF